MEKVAPDAWQVHGGRQHYPRAEAPCPERPPGTGRAALSCHMRSPGALAGKAKKLIAASQISLEAAGTDLVACV